MNISYFVHPIPLSAVAVMALNDHYLKWHYPSVWTGKLSDFAGIFFFPLFICAFVNTLRHYLLRNSSQDQSPWITRRQLLLAIVFTDLIFAGIKLNSKVASLYIEFLSLLGIEAAVIPDATDLIALGMNILTWRFARSFFDRSVLAEVHVANEFPVVPARNDKVLR